MFKRLLYFLKKRSPSKCFSLRLATRHKIHTCRPLSSRFKKWEAISYDYATCLWNFKGHKPFKFRRVLRFPKQSTREFRYPGTLGRVAG